MDQIELVVTEIHDFEQRHVSELIFFLWKYWRIKFKMQVTESTEIFTGIAWHKLKTLG